MGRLFHIVKPVSVVAIMAAGVFYRFLLKSLARGGEA